MAGDGGEELPNEVNVFCASVRRVLVANAAASPAERLSLVGARSSAAPLTCRRRTHHSVLVPLSAVLLPIARLVEASKGVSGLTVIKNIDSCFSSCLL